MKLLRPGLLWVLLCWMPLAAGQSDVISDDVIFDAPNPFAENLEQQGVAAEFSIDGSGANAAEDPYADPFAAPDFNPNADALSDIVGETNLTAESGFVGGLSDTSANAAPKQSAGRKDELPSLIGGKSQAKLAVMKHACSSGGTIERCMQTRALMPDFKDSGWAVRAIGENTYVVERVLLLNGTLPLTYSWQVKPNGKVEATTIRAEMITELPL